MIAVFGTLRFDAANADAAREACRAVAASTISDDMGCVAYRFTADLDERGAFHLFEAWENDDVFDAHRGAQHSVAFLGKLSSLGLTSVEMTRLDVSEMRPQFG